MGITPVSALADDMVLTSPYQFEDRFTRQFMRKNSFVRRVRIGFNQTVPKPIFVCNCGPSRPLFPRYEALQEVHVHYAQFPRFDW
jgi:hypothetical protein